MFFCASRRRHTRCALVTGVQTCALPISIQESLGFYCIVNHGVPQALIDDSFDQVAALFALPLETKLKYRVDYHHQGYIPTKATVLRWSKFAKNEKKDLNDAWAFMREREPADPKVRATVRHRDLNTCPEKLQAFRPAILPYPTTHAPSTQ